MGLQLPFELRSLADLLIPVAVFGLVLAAWLAVVLVRARRRSWRQHKVEQRLGIAKAAARKTRVLRLWHDGHEETTDVPGRARRPSAAERFARLIRDAGWTVPPRALAVGLLGGAGLLLALVLAATGSMIAAAAAVVAGAVIFWTYWKWRISRRVALFERQFVDALEIAGRSLRAGHPLMSAFHLIAEETAPPVGDLFAEICQEQALGMTLEQAIRSAAEKSASDDMRLFAASVAIQLRSGGNLADMMDRLSSVVRDRIRLNRRARVLIAQTQLSKRVLLALPFVLFVLLNVINPRYMEPLYSSDVGKILLGAAVAGLALGTWAMNRLVVLRY